MKRMYSIFLSLLLMAVGQTAAADVEYYSLWVAGTRVTSSNAGNVLGNGWFVYDPSDKVLTVADGAQVYAYNSATWGMYGIRSSIEGLTIKFCGEAIVRGKESALALYKPTTIVGTPNCTVDLISDGNEAIYTTANVAFGSSETDGGIFNVTAEKWGVRNGASNVSPSITFAGKGLVVFFDAASYPIYGYTDFYLEGTRMVDPAAIGFNTYERYLTDLNGEPVTGKVVIAGEDKIKYYGLRVGRTPVNNFNAADIRSCQIAGKVSYDARTKTLTLKDATIDMGDQREYGIRVNGTEMAGTLTVKLEGSNAVYTQRDYAGIDASRLSVWMKGSGSLKMNGGIELRDVPSMAITDRCTVEALRITDWREFDDVPSDITVNNSTVRLVENIGGFDNMTLTDAGFTSPAGTFYGDYYDNESQQEYRYTVTEWRKVAMGVTIEPVTNYGVEIGGVKVHSKNASDIKAAAILEGRVIYNHGTNILSLDNATLSNQALKYSRSLIKSEGKLNVNLIGENDLSMKDESYAAIVFGGEGSIYSKTDGKLTTNAGVCVADAADIYIQDASVEAAALYGAERGGGNLHITNAAVKTTGDDSQYGIKDFSSVVLTDCYIEEPAGGRYDTGSRTVVDAGGRHVGRVVITPKPEAPAEEYDITIGGTKVNSRNKGDVLGDGVFTFNPSTNMLIVKGDYSGEKAAINSSIDNLYISFTRNCTLESSVETVITLTGTTTMTSNSGVKVTLKKSGENRSSGIYHHGAGKYFIISNMNLTVCGNNKFGIVSAAKADDQSYLNISHSNIDVSASSVVLGDFRTLALASCYLTAPAGASIQNGSVVDAYGSQITGQRVVISTEQTTFISVEDITRLIDEYLTPGSSVTLGDITDLIDRYLEQ